MKTISAFFDELRLSYLNDAPGNRFKDAVLRPYFEDALLALYANEPKAFYGKKTEADLGELSGMSPASFVKENLLDYITPGSIPNLRARVMTNVNASDQRGQEQGAPLAQQQLQQSTPQGG